LKIVDGDKFDQNSGAGQRHGRLSRRARAAITGPAIVLMYHRGGIDDFTKYAVDRLVSRAYWLPFPMSITIAQRDASGGSQIAAERYRDRCRRARDNGHVEQPA
jgi:hypothetical protein